MRGYRVKKIKRGFKVQVRFLLLWRTIAFYDFDSCGDITRTRKEAVNIASELIKRSN